MANTRKSFNIEDYLEQRGHESDGVPAEEKLLWKEAEELTNLNQEEFAAYSTITSAINDSLEGQDYSINQAIEQFPYVTKGSVGYVALTQCALNFMGDHFYKEEVSELDFPQGIVYEGIIQIKTLRGAEGENITLLKQGPMYNPNENEASEEVIYRCDEVEVVPFCELNTEEQEFIENKDDAGYRDQVHTGKHMSVAKMYQIPDAAKEIRDEEKKEDRELFS